MKDNPPEKIWLDFITTYVFDYGDFYFQIESISVSADTQNKFDEAIVGKFTKHQEPFIPGEHSKLICKDKKIEELHIVRVLLYFSNFIDYSKIRRLYNRAKQMLKSIISGKKNPWTDLQSKASGAWAEITCHPNSDIAKNAELKYSNLVDCGLLVQIDGKYLKAYVERNGFGFHIWDEKYFFDIDELIATDDQFELIKV